MKLFSIPVYLFMGILLLFSCRKEKFTNSPAAQISLSADTLKFDTVFVTAGSVTQSFKLFNDNDEKLRISSVQLGGGAASAFKINVDGTPGPQVNDLEINANDSAYIFVQVKIDPASGNLPFVVRDSIRISFNGNDTLVQLEAWGRNAHFLRAHEVTANELWQNDLPYVILDYLHVNAGQTLTIDPGCRVYVHADAPVQIDGSLKINGNKDMADRVQFSGDRLDMPYANFPAAWPGLYFTASSSGNVLKYTDIRNAYQAIAIEGGGPAPKLRLEQCVIDNAYDAGIIALNSSVSAVNCLISNCGKNLQLVGGSYDFIHCTVASYANNFIDRKEPVLDILNSDGTTTVALAANFQNCIFWGESGRVNDEVRITKTGTGSFVVNFINNLWKVETTPVNITTLTQTVNEAPQFDSIDISHNIYDFRLTRNASPAIDKGVNTATLIDLDGRPRPVGLPDLGCFERQ